jgi:sugar phosphate permease
MPDRTRATTRLRSKRSIALTMLVISGVINYIDRSTLSMAEEPICAELGLTHTQMGFLLSAFSWSYAFAQLPTGALVDKVGPRILLAAGLALWSVAQACGGLVTSMRQFVATRIALGIGEAPQFPAGARVVSNWYPIRERGLPTGIFNSSSSLGPALAPPLLTALIAAFGWRRMFLIMGALGLIAAVIWYIFYRDPHHAGLAQADLQSLRADEPPPSGDVALAQWLRLFRHQTTWGMVLGFAAALYLIWLYLTWLPGYLRVQLHMNRLEVGFAASVPFIAGFLGSLAGGAVSDRLAARGISPINSRKFPIGAGLIGMALFTVPAAMTNDRTLAVGCIALAMFCGAAATANAWALVTATAPSGYVASLGSIQNFGGYFGGSFAPVITGKVVDLTGSFTLALLFGAIVAVASALVYLLVVREPISAAFLEGEGRPAD